MRPHRLAFCALGPYADEVEIDFDPLVEEGLFLIHGPTGSGKTFLLDALCFALYGDVPGERGRHTLRSDHAPLDVSPWAELEFTSQEHRWRVRRSPEHERAKMRGKGTTRRLAEATLERREGDTWQAVARKIREVNDEINEMVGLTAHQFQQVILLPQGRFEQVLRSNSEDREKLLRTLFDTTIFESASSWLDGEAKSRREAASEQERELANLRRQSAERWRSVTDEADESWPADQAVLDKLVQSAESLKKSAAATAESTDETLDAARSTHSTVERIAEHWDRRAALHEHRDKLAEEQPAIDAQRKTLGLADAAEALRQVLDVEQRHRDEFARRTTQVNEQITAVADLCGEALSLPDDLAMPVADEISTLANLHAIGSALAVHRSKLDGLTGDATRATGLESSAALERDDEAGDLRVEEQESAAATEHEEQRRAAEAELAAARSAADRVADLRAAADQATRRAEASAELEALRHDLVAAATALTDAVRATLDRRCEALDLRQRHLDGIAAVLAGTLTSDTPCPVCGSTDHPAPAEPSPDAIDAQDVEEAEARITETQKAETRARRVDQQLAAKAAELRGTAGDAADDPDGAAERADEVTAQLQAASELAAQVEELANAVASHQDAVTSAQEAAKQAALGAAAAAERAQAAEKDAANLRAGIAAAIGDVDPAAAVVGAEAVDAAIKTLSSAASDRAEAEAAFRTTTATLTEQLEPSPFATPDGARDALRSPEERDETRQRIEMHDTATRDIDRDLKADELQDLPDERPDTATSADAVTETEDAARAANAHRTRTADAHKDISGWADNHRRRTKTHTRALAEAELWSTVADRCNGRTAPKVSLQRWVLSAYLEEICTFANRRLNSMTGGRYRLGVHRDREWGGGKAGLGLRVHDTYTGSEREVSTLSGGETFQASLSLALGVADGVTAHTGGVRLDALFVDEGFGTLDSEALQLAMDELDRLRDGGRTVGLISHVGELRERIRTGIEVRPTDGGSTINVGAVSRP